MDDRVKLVEPIMKYRDLKGYISEDKYDDEFDKWYDMPLDRLKQISYIYTIKLNNEKKD